MTKYDLFNELENNTDPDKAKQMAKYMRDQFSFLGIQATKRNKITNSYFKEIKKEESIDWEFINHCWEKDYREAQYVAIEYIKRMKRQLDIKDIPKIKDLIINKSWWDTVDGLHRIIGGILLKFPEHDQLMINWSLDENIWLRRIAINHQMFRKEEMKEEIFQEILINNLNDNEFFINKAIGWSLRDYSKTNPNWVKMFIEKNKGKLSKLSIREASKYL